VWASWTARFFETSWSRKRLCCLPGDQLARAGSCRESANRIPGAPFVSNHPNLDGVVVDKLTAGTPLLVSAGVIEEHQRSLMAIQQLVEIHETDSSL
jgi:hypothetical protein